MKTKHDMDKELVAFVVPHICEPIEAQPVTVCVQDCKHLSELELADSCSDSPPEVDVLIGSDYYWELTTGEIRRGSTGPVTINTKLGWVLSGPGPSAPTQSSAINLITTHILTVGAEPLNDHDLNETLCSFWELESLGIRSAEVEKSIHDKFKEEVSFEDGRYRVLLSWKEMHDPLPDNYALSLKRLEGLIR